MKILFLGDIVGDSGCIALKKHLQTIIEENKINFVIANGENAAIDGVGITENNVKELIKNDYKVINIQNHNEFIFRNKYRKLINSIEIYSLKN